MIAGWQRVKNDNPAKYARASFSRDAINNVRPSVAEQIANLIRPGTGNVLTRQRRATIEMDVALH